MFRIINDYPRPENTLLLQAYQATATYDQLLSADHYLLAYASNTWRIQLPNCQFHPPSNSIVPPFSCYTYEMGNVEENNTLFPYKLINSMGAHQIPHPGNNSITLDFPCIVYFLADSLIIHLPTTADLGPQEGLIFHISYSQIEYHSIRSNLTKLQLVLKSPNGNSCQNSYEFYLYPLQRFPPQPLATGLYSPWTNQTPLQALQHVDLAIGQGRDLLQRLDQETAQPPESSKSYKTQNMNSLYESGIIPDDSDDVLITNNGQADDDDTPLNSWGDLKNSGMDVMLIGGADISGVKRGRVSDEDVTRSIPKKERKILVPKCMLDGQQH